MKKKLILIGLAVLFFAILIGLAVLFFAIFFSAALIPHRTLEYDMDIKVGTDKIIGINVGTDAIHFGKVPSMKISGASAEAVRELSVYSGDADVSVRVKMSGDLGQWVTAEPSKFYLGKNQTKAVTLTARMPYDIEPGIYTGKVTVIMLKAY